MNRFLTTTFFFAHLLYAAGAVVLISSLLIFLYLLTLICASALVTGHLKFFIDSGCASIHITQLFFIFFLLIPALHRATHHGWQFWIFSTGCSRRSFFLGCSAASIALIIVNTLCSFVVCLGFCWWQTGQLLTYLWPFFVSAALHGILLCTTAFLATSITTQAGSYLMVGGLYCVALANRNFYGLISHQGWSIKKIVLFACSYLLPDLSIIDIQSATMYEQPIALNSFLGASSYLLFFCAIQLSISVYLFERKEW